MGRRGEKREGDTLVHVHVQCVDILLLCIQCSTVYYFLSLSLFLSLQLQHEKAKLVAMKTHLNLPITGLTDDLKSDLITSVAIATPPTPSSTSSTASFPAVTNTGKITCNVHIYIQCS